MRTIVHLSDLHFGRHCHDAVEDLVEFTARSGADLVVVSGDFTQRARRSEFDEANRFLKRIEAPKLLIPGNHDVPLYNLMQRYLKPFEKYNSYIHPLGQTAGFFRDEQIAVLGLNTARRFTRKNGRLSLVQIEQIREFFSDLPPGICKILATHHPIGIPSGGLSIELAGRSLLALETIGKAGVHVLLSGHHHQAVSGPLIEIGEGRSPLIVHAGTAISTRTRGNEANSFNLIRIAGDKIEIEVLKWMPGMGFRESKLSNYVLANDE
jgi:3',5'-cyclic AMP phosphodiesterase CpdA